MADFNNLFKGGIKKAESEHGTYKILWLRYDQLQENPGQYCPGTDDEIENLADLIAADGQVLQNLIVKKTDNGKYEIVAGHKRREAVRRLVEQRGLDKYAFLPCMLMSKSEAKMRFSIISSNAHHDKTPYEIMHELQEMKYLIETFPDEFPDLQKGRMVERLAKQMGLARSVVSDYQNIANNLGDKGMQLFSENRIDKSTATALAGLDKKEQEILIDEGKLTHKAVKDYKKNKSLEFESSQPPSVDVSVPISNKSSVIKLAPSEETLPHIKPSEQASLSKTNERNIRVQLSDADYRVITEHAAKVNMTVGELLSSFIIDLNMSANSKRDESMCAQKWYELYDRHY